MEGSLNIMKKIAGLLIATGILLFLYPLLDRAFSWYWQQRLIKEWEDRPETAVDLLEERLFPPASEFQPEEEAYVEGGSKASSSNLPLLNLPQNPSALQQHFNTLGILEIKKIDLKLPILQGASKINLKIGAGLLEKTAEIGAFGNTVLTAHRSYTYGRFFNRLDEVEVGDEIFIATQENTYRYTVYNKVIVEPDDTSVTRESKGEKILTLVTCHPIHNATHRLVVQARMIEEDENH